MSLMITISTGDRQHSAVILQPFGGGDHLAPRAEETMSDLSGGLFIPPPLHLHLPHAQWILVSLTPEFTYKVECKYIISL